VGERRKGVEWVLREGVGAWGRNDPSLYAHMNNKRKKIKLKKKEVKSLMLCVFYLEIRNPIP
jgi:hypothetical protein